MTPDGFIQKWKHAELKERSAAQEHFIDLCHLLGEPTPAEADPKGDFYCFERGASKTTGASGWADVWKRGHFGWEYKGRNKDLTAAFAQLQQYAIALENPPLLVVCDLDRIRIHTNWTNSISVVHELAIDDLRDAAKRDLLKAVFSDPERLRPGKTRQGLTEDAAGEFAKLATRLRAKGHPPEKVAHFINRLVFCMFAEDIGLLPNKMFARMLDAGKADVANFRQQAATLFAAMRSGGMVGFERVEWFNGGLFDDDEALPLDREEIELCISAARLDWSEIDPSIFGTLFERGLDPDKRSQLGAHYTDRDKIMLIVEPVVIRPWLAEWAAEKAEIAAALAKAKQAKSASAQSRAMGAVTARYRAFLDRLRHFTMLDPACGSGNFLYLGLLALKDLEHRVMIEAEGLGLLREFPATGPQNVKGIEINPYAAELARVTVWIGEIQWMRKNGFEASKQPILKPLDTIECRDALLNPDGTEAAWPTADVIIGNPPFLGVHKFLSTLGGEYSEKLRKAYRSKLPANIDLVVFWFLKSLELYSDRVVKRIGLVATNSIRGGENREIIKKILHKSIIFEAWSDEGWSIEGTSVRVSLICFGDGVSNIRLNGENVLTIYSDLSSEKFDMTKSVRLIKNIGISFLGTKKGGPFDLPSDMAREMLLMPLNPNGRKNSDVLFRRYIGNDLAKRPEDRWIVDFGHDVSKDKAILYEAPFSYVLSNVKPMRDKNRREARRNNYWLHSETAPGMRKGISKISRYISTPRVSKFRVFVWLPSGASLDDGAIAIARDDDTSFGILHSRFHEQWSLRMCTYLGVGNDPRYTPSTTFETFPFPEGLTPDIPAADYADDPRAMRIAAAAARLNELRETWLNPPDLVRREPEVVPGYPDRILPVDEKAAAILKKRTLTNLYNERPAWLDHAHRELDAAVAAAYGWPEDISEEDALARLFALNQERAAAQGDGGKGRKKK